MNFFQIISADVSQCFLDLVQEEPLDYLGLQVVQNFKLKLKKKMMI